MTKDEAKEKAAELRLTREGVSNAFSYYNREEYEVAVIDHQGTRRVLR